MHFFKLLFLLACLSGNVLWSQDYVEWPVKHIQLTGNYGELRPNHFHAGLDFPGETEINQPIYAVKSGYVSRIKVSAYGYGKVLYISHYDGKLGVYAHQSRFNDSIDAFVKRTQIQNFSYEIELFPGKNEIQIKEGEIIGYMGNTGGSTGPHLHFEVRDEITEIPLNPLRLFVLKDTIKPICNSIAIFDLSDSLACAIKKTIKIKEKRDSLYLENDSILLNQSILGLAFNGYDKEFADGNPNNIYEVKLFYDNELFYHHQLNFISFDFGNYINEFSTEINKQKYQKCFVPEIFPADMYKIVKNKGRLELKDTLFHCIRYEFIDESGIGNSVQFYIKTKQITSYKSYNLLAKNYFSCKQPTLHSTKSFTIELQPKTVFNNGTIAIIDEFDTKKTVSISIHNTTMRLPGMFKFKIPVSLLSKSSKLVIRNNSSVIVPKINGNYGHCNFKSLGKLELMIDTLSPMIKTQFSLKKLKKTFANANQISFLVSDNLSGIGKYNLYVNDKWVMAEFDAKANLITYYFDKETPVGEMKYLLIVQDRTGNTGVLKLTLKR